MKCNEVLQHLNEYIENDLDEILIDEIRDHIEGCSECRKVYEEEKALNDMFLEALNSEPIEFNSRIGNIMNMIDKDKYSSQEVNGVNEPEEDSKVIKLESVNKKKQKKFIFNKRIIAMAATFTIMIFMAPFIIGEQKEGIQYASNDDMKIRSFDEAKNDSDKEYDMVSNKEAEVSRYSDSAQKSEDKKEQINESKPQEDVAVEQASDEESYNDKGNVEAQAMNKASFTKDNSTTFKTIDMFDYKVDLEKEHKIIFSNEEKTTTIKINNQEEDLGIINAKIVDFVKDNEYVYIACVGMDTESDLSISKTLKVNTITNEIDIIYTSLKQESIIKLELEEAKADFITITVEGQEKPKYIKR